MLGILDGWRIEPDEQCRLLGLDRSRSRRSMRRLRLGGSLPDDPDIWARVVLLMELENARRKLFPHSALSADLWVTTPRAKLGQRTPLSLMIEGGRDCIRRIARSLDNLDLH